MSRIGIISALPMEARCLGNRGIFSKRADVLAMGAMIGVSGPGSARAERMAAQLVEQGATGLVSWGMAGGLDPRIPPGTLIAADRVVTADRGTYFADAGWRQHILSALSPGLTVHEAALFASERLVATPADKARLRRRYAAVALDMESGGIACMASRHRLPFLVLRVVVDPATMALPAAFAELVGGAGRLRPGALINLLMRRPRALWPLLELAWVARIATTTLKRTAPVLRGRGVRVPTAESSLSTPP